jgi:Mg-chelatase subunit ChlD
MRILAGGLALVVLGAVPARATSVTAERPRVEVAFVLDTTGSMGGLIEGAKRRIWSIARHIGEGRPRPDLRIALVGYRDQGDAYVTRVHDFSGDLDAVYANLSAFEAGGGGDWPEHVSRALSDAVHRVSWSQGPALRIIFLVGDAPPQVSYQDGYDYRRHAREARAGGIVLETIQCGPAQDTAGYWREIAQLGMGH